MSKRDYYEILGVTKGANPQELKSAYRKLAMQYHPDRNPDNPDAEKRFKEINEAYDVLKDDQKRAAYDQFGHQAFEGGGPGGFGGARGFSGDFGSAFADVFDDLFGEFMGARRPGGGPGGQAGRARGADLRYNMEITLNEAFAGKKAQIQVPRTATCDRCDGVGAEPGSKPVTCPTCSGLGKVRATQGFFTIERTCPKCGGAGQIVKDPCKKCRGAGRVEVEKSLSVTIPPGVEDGTRIRLQGEGDAGARGGPSGDLYIFLSIASHDLFERESANLYCRVPISFTTAALGGEVEVPTLSGSRAKVKIPEGTQTGRTFRLKGLGMPVLRSEQVGDLFVLAEVETPQKLTKKQKEILREFEKASSDETHPESYGFFGRMKEFLDGFGHHAKPD
ncbi:MAG: molecular chaperone DnaJ [Alphaproteobacteria bacterium]